MSGGAPAPPSPGVDGPRSMTGFARISRERDGATFTVTLKAVNHRFLDLRWQTPPEWEEVVAALEPRLRQAVRRGHVEVRMSLDRADAGPARLDAALAAAYLQAHAELNRQLGRQEPPLASDLLRVPGMLAGAGAEPGAPPLVLIAAAFDDALGEFNRMRSEEGAALAADLRQRCERVERDAGAIAVHGEALRRALLARYRLRIEQLLDAPAVAPERLAQEAAQLAERADISEELTRLAVHCGRLRALLNAGGEMGKKLDFLAQELNREANTLLSKTGSGLDPGLHITELGLEMKAEIEKIREQVQNLE